MQPPIPAPDMVPWQRWLRDLQQMSYEAQHPEQGEILRRLQRAKHFIDHAYDEPLTLKYIARQAYFSQHHFHRLFRREFGQTPHQYLTQKRLEHARELLRTTNQSVTEICFAVGFQSVGSFSTLFRRFEGKPPSHYRTQLHTNLWDPRVQLPSCFFLWHNPRMHTRP